MSGKIKRKFFSSPIGDLSLLAGDDGILGVYFEGQKYFERVYETEQIIEEGNIFLDEIEIWLEDYFAEKNPELSRLTLVPEGTAFQKKVWAILAQIPYGQTMTYGEIAKQINCSSAQAVGCAVGKNPLSIIVPCHRVLGSQGQLTGYAGGIERKRWLLEHENAIFRKEEE